MLTEGGGKATEYTARNQVQIVCVMKCNEFSPMTLSIHLVHSFITAWIFFYLCFPRQKP